MLAVSRKVQTNFNILNAIFPIWFVECMVYMRTSLVSLRGLCEELINISRTEERNSEYCIY